MLRYRGQYRVLYEIDKIGKACEFSNITCRIKKGANICRHNNSTLNAYIPSAKIAKRLLEEYPDIFTQFQAGDSEATLLFNEAVIDKVAVILKAKVKGKDLSARPRRHITISEDRKKELTSRLKQIHANNKIIRGNARKTG